MFVGKALSTGEVLFWGRENPEWESPIQQQYPPTTWWFGLYDPDTGALKRTATVELQNHLLHVGAVNNIVEFQEYYLVSASYGVYILNKDFVPLAESLVRADGLYNSIHKLYVASDETIYAGGSTLTATENERPMLWKLKFPEDFHRLPDDIFRIEYGDVSK